MIEAQNIGKPVNELMRHNGYDVAAARELAPLSDWSGMIEPEHFVQFYETDTFLLDSLSGFIRAGLGEGSIRLNGRLRGSLDIHGRRAA